MMENGDESCPSYLPQGFRITVRLKGDEDHFGPLEFSGRKDPRVQAAKGAEEGKSEGEKSRLTNPADYENVYSLTVPFESIRKMEYEPLTASRRITVLLHLRSPAEVRKKCKKTNGKKQFQFQRVRSLFNLTHDPDNLLLSFWNKRQVIALAGEYDPEKLKAFEREAKGRIERLNKSLSIEFDFSSGD